MDIFMLSQLCPGEAATVLGLNGSGSMRRRLLDMGLTENTYVECIGKSPGGAMSAYLIRGAVIALRNEDSEKISVTNLRGCGHGANKRQKIF